MNISKVGKEILLGIILTAYAGGGHTAYSQEPGNRAHSRINGHERSLVELVEGRAEHTIAEVDDVTRKITRWLSTAGKWIAETYREELLEMRIERMTSLQIENEEVDNYLSSKYPEPSPHVEVLKFSPGKDSAYVQIEYDIHFDDAKIVKQYLIKLKDGLPEKIVGKGEEWAERYGNRIGIGELFNIILLNKEFEERWEEKKRKYERTHPRESFEYEKTSEAFEILSKSIEGYNPGKDDIVISNDMKRAQIGVKYEIKDEFGNVKGNITSYEIEQYRHSPNGWTFDEVIYSARWKDDILIGTEKNKFLHEDFRKKTKQKIMQWIKDAYEYVK